MDDRKAYSILNIRPGTSVSVIEKKYELFVKLYKRYLMGEKLKYTPEQLEEMKEAYISLLYKRIPDEELEWLYPYESQSYAYQAWKRVSSVLSPYMKRYRAKIIYTMVMFFLTLLIILIINYKPVELRITVLHEPPVNVMEYQYRSQLINTIETELKEFLYIQKPAIEYQSIFADVGMPVENSLLYMDEDVDVYVMEEALLSKLVELGFKLMPLEFLGELPAYAATIPNPNPRFHMKVDKKSTFYRYLCNLKNDNKVWIAVVPSQAKHKERALRLLGYIGTAD